MRVNDRSVPSGRFIACVCSFVTTIDRRPCCREVSPTVNTAFASVFAVSSEGGTVAATAVAQHAPLQTSTSHGEHSTAITDPAASAPSLPGNPAPLAFSPPSGRILTWTRRRTAAGPAPPTVDYGFGADGVPRPSVQRVVAPRRVVRPRPPTAVDIAPASAASSVLTVPIPSDRDRADPVGTPVNGLPSPTGIPYFTTPDLDALGATAEQQGGDSVACYERQLGTGATRRAHMPRRHALHSSWSARGLADLLVVVFSSTPAPFLLGGSGACWQSTIIPPMTALSCSFDGRLHALRLTRSSLWGARLVH